MIEELDAMGPWVSVVIGSAAFIAAAAAVVTYKCVTRYLRERELEPLEDWHGRDYKMKGRGDSGRPY